MPVRNFHPAIYSILTAVVLAGTPLAIAAATDVPELVPASAQVRLFAPEVRDRATALVERTRVSPGTVPEALDALAQDREVNPVTADAVMYDYIRRLRAEPPGSAPPEVLVFLKQYQPRAVQVHPESVAGRIPLFDVAGAARGLDHQWRHHSALEEFQNADPSRRLELMQAATAGPEAAGIRVALRRLPKSELDSLMTRMTGSPGHDDWVVETALAAGRGDEVAARIAGASPGDASRWIRGAMETLPDTELIPLLRAGLVHSDPGVQGLAMARITDRLEDADAADRAAWRDDLLTRLADPDTGSAAALQLARVADDEWLAAQREQATDPVTERRLALAARLRAGMMGDSP